MFLLKNFSPKMQHSGLKNFRLKIKSRNKTLSIRNLRCLKFATVCELFVGILQMPVEKLLLYSRLFLTHARVTSAHFSRCRLTTRRKL